MDECSPHVLATVVDFIYGIGIPEDCSKEDARSLLAMADLYLMDDLKDAVGSFIANKLTIPCLLYTSPSPRDRTRSRMPSSA